MEAKTALMSSVHASLNAQLIHSNNPGLVADESDRLREDIMRYKQCCQAALQNEGIGFTEARRLTGEIIERLIEAKKQLGQRQPLPKS